MRRVQFIEFHDQPWFPSFLRDDVTDALQFGFNLFDVYAPVAPLLERVTESTGSRSIVDMCSGAGGPWLDLSRKLDSRKSPANAPALQICLTDRYPNLGAFEKVRAASEGRIRFYPGLVDATDVPRELKGLRTMFTSFHHFLPDAGRAIVQDAVDAGEGIGIFEIARRAPSAIGLAFGFVLALFACTPWIRPFRWSRLLWTYSAADHSLCVAVRWSRVLPTDISATGNDRDCRSAEGERLSVGSRRVADSIYADSLI